MFLFPRGKIYTNSYVYKRASVLGLKTLSSAQGTELTTQLLVIYRQMFYFAAF